VHIDFDAGNSLYARLRQLSGFQHDVDYPPRYHVDEHCSFRLATWFAGFYANPARYVCPGSTETRTGAGAFEIDLAWQLCRALILGRQSTAELLSGNRRSMKIRSL
jgi:hypothetical protein